MELDILNRLSHSKKALINGLLDSHKEDFELAVAFLKTIEKSPELSNRSLKVANGPTELRSLLLASTAEKENRSVLDEFNEIRMHDALCHLNRFKSKIDVEQGSELRKMIFWDLNFQLSQAVYRQISNSTVMRRITVDFPNAINSGFSFDDADWLGFYKIVEQSFSSENSSNYSGLNFLQSGGFDNFLVGESTIILRKPIEIRRNQNLVLHSENGPAVKWKDGTDLFFWNGIEVCEDLILNPESITKEVILSEQNVEVRRCYQEVLGSERFANLLGLTCIDQKNDRFGNTMVLYRTTDKDRLIGEYIHFAKVICPSTGRSYFLCVPPKISTVDEAVAWTFGKTAKEYKPEWET